MADEQLRPIDPTKLTSLLDELEEERVTGQVAIGAVRRAVTHGRLDAAK